MRRKYQLTGLLLPCLLTLLFLARFAPAAANMDPFFAEGAIRVLILTGRNNHD